MSDEAITLLSVAPVVKPIFKPVSWLKKIDFVKRMILDNNVLISLLGEPGRGKTTFAKLLQDSLPVHIKSYNVSAGIMFNRGAFLEQLSVLLESNAASIADFVAQTNDEKSHTLLIIDDAHHLPADFIEEILEAIRPQGNSGYFHVFIISDFSLVPVLNRFAEEKYTDMIHSIEVGPLNEGETKSYVIQQLLALMGVEKTVTDERIKQFHQLTEGHILDIHREMDAFFSDVVPKKVAFHSSKRFRGMSVAATVFLAITAVTYLWHSEVTSSTQIAKQQQDPLKISTAKIDKPLSSQIPAYNVAAIQQGILPTPLYREDRSEEAMSAEASSIVAVVDKVVVAPKILRKTVAHASKQTNIASHALVAVKKTASVKLKPLIDQSRYTIQLIASHRQSELQRFVQRHHLKVKTQVRVTKRQGKVWYVLTLGDYKKRQHANYAASQLPKEIALLKPWVRSVGDLKAVKSS